MKKVCLSLLMGLMVQMTFGQTLEKMQWFNEPEQWEIKNNVLSMSLLRKVILAYFSLRFYSR